MKKEFASVLVSAVCFLAIFAVQVNGLTCYVCNSNNDSRCGSLRELGVFEETCPNTTIGNKMPSLTMCRKIIQTVDYNLGDMQSNTRIIRSCGWVDSNYTGRCYTRSGFGGRQVVCSCTTDKCNSSFNNSPSGGIIASLFTLLTALYIFS